MNWKVRIRNKTFWLAIIPAILLLIQQICAVFGIAIDISGLSDQLLGIVGTVFGILSILGIVVDPTTYGIGDSELAMTYTEPKKDGD